MLELQADRAEASSRAADSPRLAEPQEARWPVVAQAGHRVAERRLQVARLLAVRLLAELQALVATPAEV